MIIEELKSKIDVLSFKLNNMLDLGIKKVDYNEVLKVSQELDILICKYTKLTMFNAKPE